MVINQTKQSANAANMEFLHALNSSSLAQSAGFRTLDTYLG